jgi:hypothetical protein
MLGHRDSYVDFEEIALPVSRLRPGDRHMTARYPIAQPFQALRLLGDLGSNLFRGLAVLKRDLDWRLHMAAPSFWNGFAAPLIGPPRRVECEC